MRAVREVDVVVVGAGFAGLYMLHRLRGLGFDARVLEAGDGVGGTWYWNRYPGARCDSESYYYSYSFSPELEQEWRWSERYPGQEEIRSYLDHVADRFDLRPDIELGTSVTTASYDEDAGRWLVDTVPTDATDGAEGAEGADRLRCRWLVTAVGCLSTANVPDIPGLDAFRGTWHHTGRWPHEGVDVAGQRVGVVGTGSTGIQAIPVLAASAGHLTVFQRTANYSVPARNAPLSAEEAAGYKSDYPVIREVQRTSTNGHPFTIAERSTPSTRSDVGAPRGCTRRGWERGGLAVPRRRSPTC